MNEMEDNYNTIRYDTIQPTRSRDPLVDLRWFVPAAHTRVRVFELKSRFVSQKLHRLRVHSVSNVMNIITILTVAHCKSGPMTVEQTCETLIIYIYVHRTYT